MADQANPLPQPGERLVHRSHKSRGLVLGIVGDEKEQVLVVRFWFNRKKIYHYEAVPTWMWGEDYCPISREKKR